MGALGVGKRTDWNTPPEVLERVYQVGPVALDPCSNANSLVRCAVALDGSPGKNGLAFNWVDPTLEPGIIFVNCPYGRSIGEWLHRCWLAANAPVRPREVIALIPATPDTRWWGDWVAPPKADAVCFWRGRLKFLGAEQSATFPSAVVYWGRNVGRFVQAFADVANGQIWTPDGERCALAEVA